MSPKEIRLSHGLSVERAAVYAGVTSPTLRLYEANQSAPRPDTRALLAAYYARLAATQPTRRPLSPSSAVSRQQKAL